ncbi:hypothetical protein BS50DRAFT_331725 [Corynespora cassiicola Philippines]|uniref:Bacteriophage T5 Orf172 DNA-binding domain-containing protein n=1 Tax=Corynespora cassiicola Philippines TaxID=1448308 RepID=A0A2T2NUF6_CORCC|nr:hypothetical protein BS50DRAFT_331725 [Corynespora cassiicola Philippines]
MDPLVFSTETRLLPGSFPSPIPLPADAPRTPENRGHASSPNDFTASSFNRRQPLFGKMRSESPPSPTVQKSPQLVHEKLRSRLNKVTLPKGCKGFVYIFRNPKDKLLKIGSSETPYERGQKIKSKCGIQIEVVHTSAWLEDYGRAESLAHGDLWDLCRPFTCVPCSHRHREWHEVDDELATKTVDRWVKFVKEEKPYDSGGSLKGLWKFLFSERQQVVPWVAAGDVAGNVAGNEKRRENIALMLESPSVKERAEYAWFVISRHPIWALLWEFPWQVSTVIAWLIMFLIARNSVVFLILAIYVGLVWFSMSFHFKRGLKLKGLGRR